MISVSTKYKFLALIILVLLTTSFSNQPLSTAHGAAADLLSLKSKALSPALQTQHLSRIIHRNKGSLRNILIHQNHNNRLMNFAGINLIEPEIDSMTIETDPLTNQPSVLVTGSYFTEQNTVMIYRVLHQNSNISSAVVFHTSDIEYIDHQHLRIHGINLNNLEVIEAVFVNFNNNLKTFAVSNQQQIVRN